MPRPLSHGTHVCARCESSARAVRRRPEVTGKWRGNCAKGDEAKVLKMKLVDFARVYQQSRIDYQLTAVNSESYTTWKTLPRVFGRSPKI